MGQQISIDSLDSIDSKKWHDIVLLRSKAFVSEQKCVYTDPDERDLDSLHATIFNEEELLAYARFFNSDGWHIGRVVVNAKHRGHGLGNKIMELCIDNIVKSTESPDITLSAQVYLTDFYRNIGFKPIDSIYLEDGIPHIKMVYSRIG